MLGKDATVRTVLIGSAETRQKNTDEIRVLGVLLPFSGRPTDAFCTTDWPAGLITALRAVTSLNRFKFRPASKALKPR